MGSINTRPLLGWIGRPEIHWLPTRLYLKYGTNRLYVKREKENKEFFNIDDNVQMAKMRFVKLWQQDCENIIILLGKKNNKSWDSGERNKEIKNGQRKCIRIDLKK